VATSEALGGIILIVDLIEMNGKMICPHLGRNENETSMRQKILIGAFAVLFRRKKGGNVRKLCGKIRENSEKYGKIRKYAELGRKMRIIPPCKQPRGLR